ncbi:MAG: hypothetical protein ABI683_12970, partial [Ginsengibacter sp.]
TPVDKSAAIGLKNNDKDSVVTVSHFNERNEANTPLKEQKIILTANESEPNIKNNIFVINETPKPSQIEITDTVAIEKSSTDISVITSVFPGKKLTVVHINELGEIAEQPIVARKTETHSFRLNFGKQEVFTNSSMTSVKDGFTIFSTKNSPN